MTASSRAKTTPASTPGSFAPATGRASRAEPDLGDDERQTAGSWTFGDGKSISSTFTNPNAIHPSDAEGALRAAFEAIGGSFDSGFEPDEQDGSKAIDGNGEYINASMRVVLPDGRAMWVTVECPTDRAF